MFKEKRHKYFFRLCFSSELFQPLDL